MKQIADFHIHSRYSRACSRDLVLENIDKTCRTKGIDIIGTGDFTFPAWFADIESKLEEISSSGLFKLKSAGDSKVKFILTTEVSLIYKKGDKARRIHLVIHAPSVEAVRKLNAALDKDYNIRSDGRPILGMSAPDLARLCLAISPDFLIYPAHIWTPWFSVFGSKSGFDKLEECFEDFTKDVFAYETGLSSDPEMNWRLSALDRLTLLSNSDAHSLPNLAREANVFELEEVSYASISRAIKEKKNLKYTIEFYPEEGMYHYDGHRDCGISFGPAETKKHRGLCPKCKKPLVIGVMNRVEELADRPASYKPKGFPGFVKLVELDKIIAEAMGVKSRKSKKVLEKYGEILKNASSSELDILIDAPLEKIKKAAGGMIAEGIRRMRTGELAIQPGFDGQYGVVKIFKEEEKAGGRQAKMF